MWSFRVNTSRLYFSISPDWFPFATTSRKAFLQAVRALVVEVCNHPRYPRCEQPHTTKRGPCKVPGCENQCNSYCNRCRAQGRPHLVCAQHGSVTNKQYKPLSRDEKEAEDERMLVYWIGHYGGTAQKMCLECFGDICEVNIKQSIVQLLCN